MDKGATSEPDLIAAAASGNMGAFSELMRQYRARVLRTAYGVVGSPEVAEDVAQEVFIKIWNSLPGYHTQGAFTSWLYRITVNASIDILRRQRAESPLSDSKPDSRELPEDATLRHEERRRVQQALQVLPEGARVALILREYEQLSYKEIAEVLQVPIGTVMSRLNYARQALKKDFSGQFLENGGNMQHLDDIQLQSFLDGELAEPLSRRIQAHVEQCADCQARLQEWRSLSLAVCESLPSPGTFHSEGEFWARLAGALPPRRPATWPLVPYLPPLLLGALGAVLDLLITVAFVVYGLISLGLLPSVGSWLAAQFSALMADSATLQTLDAWLGAQSTTILQQGALIWQGLSMGAQDALIFIAVLLVLGIGAAILVILYLTWAMCWSKPASLDRNGGN